MRKIYLTEEQFRQYVKQQLSESIFMEKDAGKFGASKLKNVTDYLADKAKQTDDTYGTEDYEKPNGDNIIRQARENGINIDSLRGNITPKEHSNAVEKRVDALIKEKNKEIGTWVKSALPTLRSVYGHSKDFKVGKEIATRNRDERGNLINKRTERVFDQLPAEKREHVLMVRDFLDKEGLTFLYRPANKPSSFSTRYGINIDDVDETTPIDDLNLDFSNLSDSDIKQYYNGTRIKWINAELEKLGYDINRTPAGQDVKVTPEDPAWNGEDGKEGLVDIARAGKLKQVAARYVKRTYGMDFNFGDGKSVFSFGNQKISDDTLIINFSAALRCPAWNECLLKDACYARTTEKNYDNTFDRNLRTSLIWQQTENDETLTNLMLELIRSYIFNYDAAVKVLNKKGYKGKLTKDGLSKLSLYDIKRRFGDDVISVLSDTKRVTTVRLNEDGDFIGQWLVDVWDKWAEDFKLAGVTVAAYTCRALNYENVKNLILNLSQEGLVNNQNAPAVARYFYAVEPEDYDALAETYAGPLTGDTITPMYRPLIADGKVEGYYYKCPCGRGKMKYVEIPPTDLKRGEVAEPCTEGEFRGERAGSKKIVKFNGRIYRLVKNDDASTKVDCYKCRICYGRDNGEINVVGGGNAEANLPKYVLVSAHGAARDNYQEERRIAGRDVKEWISLQNQEQGTIYEGIEENPAGGENSPLAIKQITKNAVESVADMMANKSGALMEMNNKFNDILKKLN